MRPDETAPTCCWSRRCSEVAAPAAQRRDGRSTGIDKLKVRRAPRSRRYARRLFGPRADRRPSGTASTASCSSLLRARPAARCSSTPASTCAGSRSCARPKRRTPRSWPATWTCCVWGHFCPQEGRSRLRVAGVGSGSRALWQDYCAALAACRRLAARMRRIVARGDCGHRFPVTDGIPQLFWPHDSRATRRRHRAGQGVLRRDAVSQLRRSRFRRGR